MKTTKTLFLDRDGVINELLPMDYVKNTKDFVFRADALEALADLTTLFDYLIVVTNQQGVGKGLMSQNDLEIVHQHMLSNLYKNGARITKIYSCTHLKEENCDCRKPKPGMLIKAFKEYPDIRSEHSILVGDSPGDIDMANSCGIYSVAMIHSYNQSSPWNTPPDYFIQNLKELKEKVLPLIKF